MTPPVDSFSIMITITWAGRGVSSTIDRLSGLVGAGLAVAVSVTD